MFQILILFISVGSYIFKNLEVSLGVEVDSVTGVIFFVQITSGIFEAGSGIEVFYVLLLGDLDNPAVGSVDFFC